jgi:hypothetical protein
MLSSANDHLFLFCNDLLNRSKQVDYSFFTVVYSGEILFVGHTTFRGRFDALNVFEKRSPGGF